jgi:hypothetical protein
LTAPAQPPQVIPTLKLTIFVAMIIISKFPKIYIVRIIKLFRAITIDLAYFF